MTFNLRLYFTSWTGLKIQGALCKLLCLYPYNHDNEVRTYIPTDICNDVLLHEAARINSNVSKDKQKC